MTNAAAMITKIVSANPNRAELRIAARAHTAVLKNTNTESKTTGRARISRPHAATICVSASRTAQPITEPSPEAVNTSTSTTATTPAIRRAKWCSNDSPFTVPLAIPITAETVETMACERSVSIRATNHPMPAAAGKASRATARPIRCTATGAPM
jgi:hypothetical protein